MHILARPASPAFATGDKLELDNSLGAEIDRNVSVRPLGCEGHEDAGALLERRQHFGFADNLTKMWRTDLLFAFGHQHQIHREFAACAPDRMKRGEKRGLRTFLIDGATAHNYFAEPGPVDN